MQRHGSARPACTAKLTACIALALGAAASAQPAGGAAEADGDWPLINRTAAATRYSPLDEIDARNVASLAEAWRFTLDGNSTAVPVVVAGVMYVPSGRRVVALDAATGEVRWAYVLESQGEDRPPTVSNRGVSYWPGRGERGARILFMSGSRLHAVDAASGAPVRGFGEAGSVDVGVPYAGTPTIVGDAAVIGAAVGEVPEGPAGNPRAFDVVTGRKIWEFQTVPGPGEPFNETWGDGWRNRSGANMWAFAASADLERGLVYLPIAGPAANYYGGDRPGSNVFANSIVAVEAATGEYVWHFQLVHHDLWDVDMPSAPTLFDFVDGGRRVPAIAYVGKSSYLFVLDRVTGEPLIEVEERPVPAGDVPGEWYSPTQPFPVRPGPLSRVSFDADADLVRPGDTTPEHAAACRRFMELSGGYYNEGPFTPFLYKGPDDPPRSTIQLPGGTGGVNWGGMAFDPGSGIAYVNAHDTSLAGWVEDRDPEGNYGRGTAESEQPYDRASILGPGPYAGFNAPIDGGLDENGRGSGPSAPCYRPPWGRLTAVNLARGEIVWTSVLGLDEDLPEGRRLVGSSGSAGPTVTAGGLVFVGATSDARFRAFDAGSGEELWAAQLDANANANPMSYADAEGRQHVAVVAGETLVVYALP